MAMASISGPSSVAALPCCYWTWAELAGRYRFYLIALTLYSEEFVGVKSSEAVCVARSSWTLADTDQLLYRAVGWHE
jgi:hypothetical protein